MVTCQYNAQHEAHNSQQTISHTNLYERAVHALVYTPMKYLWFAFVSDARADFALLVASALRSSGENRKDIYNERFLILISEGTAETIGP